MSIELPKELKNGINRWLGDVMADMCEGADDPECVAEAVISVMDCHEREAEKALTALINEHGYRPVMKEIVKYVEMYV